MKRAWEDVMCGMKKPLECTYAELNGECHQVACHWQKTRDKHKTRTQP